MVSAKRTTCLPSSRGERLTSAAFDTAVERRPATTRVMPKTALKSGSSQQGKARRASVASNWVVAMTWSTPSSSVKVLR